MSILGPDGQPIRKLTDQQIIQALASQKQQIERLSVGGVQTGLFIEWLFSKVQDKLSKVESYLNTIRATLDDRRPDEEAPDMTIDPAEFPKWAEQRYMEVAEEQRKAALGETVNLEEK